MERAVSWCRESIGPRTAALSKVFAWRVPTPLLLDACSVSSLSGALRGTAWSGGAIILEAWSAGLELAGFPFAALRSKNFGQT